MHWYVGQDITAAHFRHILTPKPSQQSKGNLIDAETAYFDIAGRLIGGWVVCARLNPWTSTE